MKFNGTIVITDPCYLDNGNTELTDWWEESEYGKDLSKYGFTDYISEHTVIGDWEWEVFDPDTNESLGEFTADAGRVCVCYLEEVNKFNPDFEKWLEIRPWRAAIIEGFDGDITYVQDDESGFRLIGKGNINFETYG